MITFEDACSIACEYYATQIRPYDIVIYQARICSNGDWVFLGAKVNHKANIQLRRPLLVSASDGTITPLIPSRGKDINLIADAKIINLPIQYRYNMRNNPS